MPEYRLNVTLPSETNERLDKFILEAAKAQGKVPYGLKVAIARVAIAEWLDRNEKNPGVAAEIIKKEAYQRVKRHSH